MSNVHHHRHIRKRIFKYKQPFPSKKKSIQMLDHLVTWLGVGSSVVTMHQVYLIFKNQDAGSVSILAWAYFTLFSSSFLLYGIVHKEKTIIAIYSFMATSNLLVVVGGLVYR